MTEEQAKDILDFLARRIGYLRIEIRRRILCYSNVYLGCIYKNSFSEECYHNLLIDDMFNTSVTMNSCSYLDFLRHILELSKDGYDIKCYGCDKLFLKKNSSLDAIKIEMDLASALS